MDDLVRRKRVAFGAYAEPLQKKEKIKSNTFKIALVASDCLLLGLQPVLVHLSKNKSGKFSFNPISVNLMTEIFKVVFALTVLLFLGTGRPGPPMYRSVRSFIADARHNWLLAVPAGLYAINNYLKFAMQLYFRPTTTKMLSNLKIFTIAILMRTVMHRRFNIIQYEALFLLVAGITINQLQSCGKGGEQIPGGSLLPAVLCVLGSVTVPSAASVYNEKGLKKHMDTSVHLQNFFLYFYGMCFNLLGALGVCLYQQRSFGSIFEHQSKVTLMLVVNNALQGILSSFFYKFADTILKNSKGLRAAVDALFSSSTTALLLLHKSVRAAAMHRKNSRAVEWVCKHRCFEASSILQGSAALLSTPMVPVAATEALASAGLCFSYQEVLEACARPVAGAWVWVQAGAVPDAPELAKLLACGKLDYENSNGAEHIKQLVATALDALDPALLPGILQLAVGLHKQHHTVQALYVGWMTFVLVDGSVHLRPQQQQALQQQVTPQLLQQLLDMLSKQCSPAYSAQVASSLCKLPAGAAIGGDAVAALLQQAVQHRSAGFVCSLW
ncbi:hypothetical protein OEZ86_000734 [Tetradesmus obliquus]|nr:hypothetical protein OEZ86_000734 [Tetradesmus obliquus]